EARPRSGLQDLQAERTVEALVFAAGLRVVRPAVADVDSQPHEPGGEASMRLPAVAAAPGRPVVQEDRLRQAVGSQDGQELAANRLAALVGGGLKTEVKTGGAVQHRQ